MCVCRRFPDLLPVRHATQQAAPGQRAQDDADDGDVARGNQAHRRRRQSVADLSERQGRVRILSGLDFFSLFEGERCFDLKGAFNAGNAFSKHFHYWHQVTSNKI